MKQKSHARKREFINEPKVYVETTYSVYLRGHLGYGDGINVYLDERQVAEYEADPDLFAARHFGFITAEEYREWVRLEGLARCSERTKQGRQCNAVISGPRAESSTEWFARHRSSPCKTHWGA